jgi:SAM-dependent methyltransferase
VIDARHAASDYDAVTETQRAALLPRLRAELTGAERLAVDFGCGPARFTADLAAAIGGRAVGVDVTRELLSLAPRHAAVDYVRYAGGRLPLRDGCADAVWCCHVLGGIVDARELERAAAELLRVLAPGGLLFLVENTSDLPDAPHWRFRSVAAYCALFAPARLRHRGGYLDMGETCSVLAGRADR